MTSFPRRHQLQTVARPVWRALAGMAALALSACASAPLDLSPDEWDSLTPEQQQLALDKQAEVDALSSSLSVEASRNAALSAISESARNIRVDARRKRARLGDILECALGESQGGETVGGLPLAPVGFEVVRGEAKTIGVGLSARVKDRSQVIPPPYLLFLDYADSGLVLRLCSESSIAPGVPAPVDRCATVAAPFRDFSNGIDRVITVPDLIASASVRCVFAPGAPVQVIDIQDDLEQKPVSVSP